MKPTRLFLIIITALFFIASCTINTQDMNNPLVTPPAQPEPGMATVTGRVISENSGLPLSDTIVRLAEVVRQEDEGAYVLDVAFSPGTDSDGEGFFIFENVDAYEYVIVAMKLGDYSAGIYSAASGVLNALFIVPNTVGFVIVPVLSNLFASHVEQAWLTAKRALGLLLIIGIGLFVTIFFGARLLVLILGQSYSESQEILQLLSIIILFQSINYGTAAILVATNQQAKRTAVQFIAVSINVILNLLVIDRFGLIGVAYVYIITEIVLMIGYALLVVRYRRKTYLQSNSSEE